MGATDDVGQWARSVEGDGAAFAELYDRHRDRVFRHAARLVTSQHDAEDVLAAAFLELWRRRGDVRLVNGSVLPWLLVTTSNVARNVGRGTRRYRALLDRLPREATTADTADTVLAAHPMETLDPDLATALRSLGRRDLQLFTLVVLEDYPIADAAALLSLSPGAAKTRLHRTRLRLRGQLTGHHPHLVLEAQS
jgi:RNA polymerase sigma-70 factor (ECF subfamily)